jgi:hypothetical protein
MLHSLEILKTPNPTAAQPLGPTTSPLSTPYHLYRQQGRGATTWAGFMAGTERCKTSTIFKIATIVDQTQIQTYPTSPPHKHLQMPPPYQWPESNQIQYVPRWTAAFLSDDGGDAGDGPPFCWCHSGCHSRHQGIAGAAQASASWQQRGSCDCKQMFACANKPMWFSGVRVSCVRV